MYATIEAIVKNGRVVPLEPGRIPKAGRVLLTLLPDDPPSRHTWAEVKSHLGWLKSDVDSVKWQKEIRTEWETRG